MILDCILWVNLPITLVVLFVACKYHSYTCCISDNFQSGHADLSDICPSIVATVPVLSWDFHGCLLQF